jgi:hypothetical protein
LDLVEMEAATPTPSILFLQQTARGNIQILRSPSS